MILKNQISRRLNQEEQELQIPTQFRIREVCMYCVLNKYHGDTRLITMLYQRVIDKFKKQCKAKNDTEFQMKVGVNFDIFQRMIQSIIFNVLIFT